MADRRGVLLRRVGVGLTATAVLLAMAPASAATGTGISVSVLRGTALRGSPAGSSGVVSPPVADTTSRSGQLHPCRRGRRGRRCVLPAPSITTVTLAPAQVGTAYTAILTGTGVGRLSWSATGLPRGLSLAAIGVITGTPAEVGNYRIILRVIDQRGQTATVTVPLVVTPQGGHVVAWGFGLDGELGDGATVSSPLPVPVSGLTSAIQVVGSYQGGFALATGGTVWAWGNDDVEHVGPPDGVLTDSLVPVQVSGLTNVTAISASGQSGYALRADGTVWAWGYNNVGQLGDNSTLDSPVPVQVSGLASIIAISGGGVSGYALRSDGTVWAWGYNSSGQLGNNSTLNSPVPVQVSGLPKVKAIAAGGGSGYALVSGGAVWAWGMNTYGQLGNGGGADSHVPVEVSGLSSVTAIAGGEFTGYARRSNGTVAAWGDNEFGQLGNNTDVNSVVPVQVSGLTSVTAISGGAENGYALRSDGTAWDWGSNSAGELGTGTISEGSEVPVMVVGLTPLRLLEDSNSSFAGYAITAN
jgi:alpha-tubulin suppressor-like RCC1 family protein